MSRASPLNIRIPPKLANDIELSQYMQQQTRFLVDLWKSFVPLQPSAAAVDYTTSTSEMVICTAVVTISLNALPVDMEEVIVKRTGGTVVVAAGGGLKIDTASSKTISSALGVLHMIYTDAAAEWSVV